MREWNARVYRRVSVPHIGWSQSVVARIPLRGDETVLDLGCGTGHLSAGLMERLPRGRVIGVDLSRNMLETARKDLQQVPLTRIAFVLADVAWLPFQNTADAIVSSAAFHWVKDHDRLFGSLFSALKPGGRLIAQCGGAGNIERVHERCRQLTLDPALAKWFTDFSTPWEFADASTTVARLERAGFDEVRAELVAAPVQQPDAVSYREFVEHVVARPFLAPIRDASDRDRFMTALTESAASDVPAFELDYVRLNLEARKPSTPPAH